MKNTTDEIRKRFDADVERFSNLETGQTATMDAALVLGLIENCISAMHPDAKHVCDIGCGAGNFTLRILRQIPDISCTLIDLSGNMLARAQERIASAGGKIEKVYQEDIRNLELPSNHFDVIIAAAVLHHLRSQEEWGAVLKNIHSSLVKGGTFWIWDLVVYDEMHVEQLQQERYADYLIQLKGEDYQREVFAYIDREDTPVSSSFMIMKMLEAGFGEVEIIHKNSKFCALYGKK